MTMSIREFTLRDELMLTEMMDVISPGWADALAPGASGPMSFVADSNTFAFGAYVTDADHDSEPAGFAWGHHQRRPDGRVMTYLHSLDVVPHLRRRGIATLLVSAVLDLGRRRGDRNVWLSTSGDNLAAQALYESLDGQRRRDSDLTYTWYFEQ